MKSANDYLRTSLWYKEKITDPYQVIAEFFLSADLTEHRKCIKAALVGASGNHIWRKINPGDLLYDFKILESVINAAYIINKKKKKSSIIVKKEESFNPNLFCGRQTDFILWRHFPRNLSFKEYANPYLTFKRFFNYLSLAEWKQELNDLLEYALVETSMYEGGIYKDILSLYFHLIKLVEAAHLIDVRETNHIGGIPKNEINTAH